MVRVRAAHRHGERDRLAGTVSARVEHADGAERVGRIQGAARTRLRAGGDEGSGTVLVVALVAVALVLAAGAGTLGRARAGRAQAQVAADLAALAAAEAVHLPAGVVAEQAASRNVRAAGTKRERIPLS